MSNQRGSLSILSSWLSNEFLHCQRETFPLSVDQCFSIENEFECERIACIELIKDRLNISLFRSSSPYKNKSSHIQKTGLLVDRWKTLLVYFILGVVVTREPFFLFSVHRLDLFVQVIFIRLKTPSLSLISDRIWLMTQKLIEC